MAYGSVVRRFGAGAAALLLVVAGCSFGKEPKRSDAAPATEATAEGCRETGLITESRTRRSGPPGPSIKWDEPLGGTPRTFASIEDAARALRFRPIVPVGITPCEVLVSPWRPAALTLRFQDPRFGIFNVSQRKPELPVARAERVLRGMAGPCADQGCEGIWSLARLSDGRDALLTLGRDLELATHNIIFIDQSGVEVVIQGPPHTFKREDAVAVANAFVAGAAV
jgi:hypothetical protein